MEGEEGGQTEEAVVALVAVREEATAEMTAMAAMAASAADVVPRAVERRSCTTRTRLG